MQGKIKLSQTTKAFKYKQFEAEVILWSVRWYCQFAISYRDLVLMAQEGYGSKPLDIIQIRKSLKILFLG